MDSLEGKQTQQRSLFSYEKHFWSKGYKRLAGVDEAGRGPLAGPVVAAAVVISKAFIGEGVNDSKQLSPSKRAELFEKLINDPGIDYGIGIVDHECIDKINILQATIVAMKQAIHSLAQSPSYLLVDGLHLDHENIPCEKIIKGDAKSISIAAASILAKETRDRLMIRYHDKWPEYGFKEHKGYGTRKHLQAIQAIGPCPIHRKTFEPIKSQFSLINTQN